MDLQYEPLKSIDDVVLDRMRKVVDDSVKQISRNVHNILKLLRKIQDACATNGHAKNPSLREIFKTVKLENWLTYFESLSRKISNSFSDIFHHLNNILDEEERAKLEKVLPSYEGYSYSWSELINSELPVLKEEVAFLLNFINYPNRQLSGILEQHQRPDGGTHIISKSIATTPAAVNPKYTTIEPGPSRAKQTTYFEITSREWIDVSKYNFRDMSKRKACSPSEDHVSRHGQQERALLGIHAGRHLQSAHRRRQQNTDCSAGAG